MSKDFFNKVSSYMEQSEEGTWEGTLGEYIELLMENPKLHAGAHERILNMINSHGVDRNADGDITNYKFFENELFGVEDSISELMSYLRAAAAGSEVGRRILLMYGPTSSGKSQLAIMLKRGLESYSRTDDGAIYRLTDSTMNEDPLVMIPTELRKDFEEQYGIKIVGEPSPLMSLILKEKYGGNFMNMRVERYFISERDRASIGTFVPSDKKSQDISELIGSIDLSTIGEFGAESDPRAYRFDGELNVANRGMMEFVEMLKVDQKFLYVLLTLAQEKNIKTGRFPLIWADEFVLAHSIVGDEPMPYRKNGLVCFDTIESLSASGDTDIEVIARNNSTGAFEWTGVSNFYSHPFTGNLIKTIQGEGVIETTYNHSLIDLNGNCTYPEDKRDVLSVRSIPNTDVISEFSLKMSNDMVWDREFLRITDNPELEGSEQFRNNKVRGYYNLERNRQDVMDLLTVLSSYLRRGHVNSSHCIISQNDLTGLNLVKNSAENISTSNVSIQERSSSGEVSRLHLSSKIWKDLIELNCCKNSAEKVIPDFIVNLPEEFLQHFFNGLMREDVPTLAMENSLDYRSGRFFSYETSSKMLASQVGYIASLLNLDYSVGHSYTASGEESYQIKSRSDGAERGNEIETLPVESLVVYDIACKGNHTFAAGVGQLMCHNTNETEFKRFLGKDEMEALHDRTIVVKVPYNLSVDNEVKIYEKLINQANFGDKHVAPHTLKCAAMFAILSRLKDSDNKGLSILKKMKMYNGEQVNGFTLSEVGKFQREFDDEGMHGVSPRYVINRISSKLAEDNLNSITPLDIVRSLRDGMKTNPKVDKKEADRLETILLYVLEEYEKLAKNDVQKAFFVNFESEIANLLKNYMEHVDAFLDNGVLVDEWGDSTEPSERLMRSIEEKIGVSESGKTSFRQEILRKMLRNGGKYEEHPALKEALEKQLFDERQDVIRLTVSARNPDEEELKRINVVVGTLCDKYGYTADSANQLLRYVNSLMARK